MTRIKTSRIMRIVATVFIMAINAPGAVEVTTITNGCTASDRIAMAYNTQLDKFHIVFTHYAQGMDQVLAKYVEIGPCGVEERCDVGRCDGYSLGSRRPPPISIAVDSVSGSAAIAYRAENGDLRYAWPTNNVWTNELVTTRGRTCALGFNEAGPYILFSTPLPDYNVGLASRAGNDAGGWIETIESWNDACQVDVAHNNAAGDPVWVYQVTGWGGPSHVYAYTTGTGHSRVDGGTDSCGTPAVAVDSRGNVHVSLYNFSQSSIDHACWNENDAEWRLSEVDTNLQSYAIPSITADSNMVYITYVTRHDSTEQLRLAVLSDGAWTTRQLWQANDMSDYSSLALDNDGAVNVAFIASGTAMVIRVYDRFTDMSPTGMEATDRRPTLTWRAVDPAQWYQIVIHRNNGRLYFRQWLQQSDQSFTPPNDLPGGDYSWAVRSWNEDTGLTDWSDPAHFTVATVVPEKTVLLGPQGVIATSRPEFTWSSGENEIWHQIWINNRHGQSFYKTWLPATTSLFLRKNLEPGEYKFWVRAWGVDGSGPWSEPMSFSFGISQPIGPTGAVVNTRQPVLSWTPVPADQYLLHIERNGSNFVKQTSVEAPATSYTPPSSLPHGEYVWWIRAWSAMYGLAPWSRSATFIIPAEIPAKIVSAGAEDAATNGVINYSWVADPAASAYELKIKRNGVEWYAQSYAGINAPPATTNSATIESFLSWSGCNLPWINYGFDTGLNPYSSQPAGFAANRDKLREHFAYLKSKHVNVVRVWIFGDFRTGLTYDDEGNILSVDECVYPDMAALMEESANYGLGLIVVLTDYLLADGVSTENGNVVGEHPDFIADTTRRTQLIDRAFRPVVRAFLTNNTNNVVRGIEIINEPRLATAVTQEEMASFIRDCADAINEEAPGVPVTVGYYDRYHLDQYGQEKCSLTQVHHFDHMSSYWEYNTPATEIVASGQPVLIGETEPTDVVHKLTTARANGFAGVLFWSLTAPCNGYAFETVADTFSDYMIGEMAALRGMLTHSVEGHVSGDEYTVQVRGQSPDGFGPWSNPVTIIVE